ncbi:hypothetical protein [Nonomuraea sp. NPDC049480]|uniref:hypothetical protein n=1 Tax=Nonomuraea sp. NPDC049480 TaxID=3364353 RepID=UPI00379ABD83
MAGLVLAISTAGAASAAPDRQTADPITAEQLRLFLFRGMYDPASSRLEVAATLKALENGQAAELPSTASTATTHAPATTSRRT